VQRENWLSLCYYAVLIIGSVIIVSILVYKVSHNFDYVSERRSYYLIINLSKRKSYMLLRYRFVGCDNECLKFLDTYKDSQYYHGRRM
jgi:hypothetical protein